METPNATGTLSLAIETSQADQALDRLESRLTRIGVGGGVANVGAGSQESAAKLRVLEAEVEQLTRQLNTNAEAKEKLGRVTRSWSAAEGAARVSFRENAQLSGEQVKALAQQAEELKNAEKATRELGRAKDQANRLELRVIAAEEAAKLRDAEKAAKELARAKDLANRFELRVIAAEEAAKLRDAERAAKELARSKDLANRLELRVIAAEEAAKLRDAEKATRELGRAKDQANRLELRVIAAEEAAKVKEAAKATRELLAAQKASAAYASATPRQQASINLRAGIALDRGYDTSGYAAEALAAAQAAGSVEALRSAKAALVPQTKQLTGANRELSEGLKELHTGARGVAGSFGALWMTYGSLIPLLTGAALGAAFKSTLEKGAEFEYQLTFVKALGGESAEAVQKLSAAALDLGKNGLYGPIKVAEGMRILAQAGLDAKEQLAAIPQVLNLATVGELGVDAAAETLVGVATAFGKTKLQLQEVGDVIAKAAAVSQTSVSGMAESMKYASVVGEQYKVSLEDTSTALAVLAKLNITGTSAGTAFRNMVKELYTPTAEAAKAFKLLGVETKDSIGNMRNMVDIIYDIKTQLEKYDSASQTNILQKMFGERGAKEAIAMLALTRDEWNKLRSDIADSQGFMGRVAAELEATTSGTMKQAFNTLEASMIEVFNSSKYGMGELAASLKNLFGSSEFKQLVADFVKITAGAARALLDFKDVLLAVASGYVIGKVAVGVEALIVSMRGLAGASAVAAGTGGLTGVAAVLPRVATALAPLAGPVGLVVGLGVAFTALWANMREGKTAADVVIGESERVVETLNRQNQKLIESNDALRERIRIAKGLKIGEGDNSPLKAIEDGVKKIKDEIKAIEVLQSLDDSSLWTEQINTLKKKLDAQYAKLAEAKAEVAKGNENEAIGAQLKAEAESAEKLQKQQADIRKLIEDLNNSKKDGARAMAKMLRESSPLLDRADVIKAAQEFLDKGKLKVDNDSWSSLGNSNKGKAKDDLVAAAKQRMETLFQEYQDFTRAQKALAADFQISFEDAYTLDISKLESNRKAAEKVFDSMVVARGSTTEALERSNAERLAFDRRYVEAAAEIDRQRLAQRTEFFNQVERAELESGAKSLSTVELYQREWNSKFGNSLKEALLMSGSMDEEVAARGRQLATGLLNGFSTGLQGVEIDKSLKTITVQLETYKAKMGVLLKKDQNGGLLGVIFGGSARDIESLKAKTIESLQGALDVVNNKIAAWNASGDSDKRIQLLAERDKLEAQLEDIEAIVSPALKDLADTLGMGIANAITNGFKAGENPGKTFARNIGDALKKSITKALSDELSRSFTSLLSDIFGTKSYGDLIRSGISWLVGDSASGSSSGSGSLIGAIGSLSTLYKMGTAFYAKVAGTAATSAGVGGGTGLTIGSAGQTGITLGSAGQTGITAGTTTGSTSGLGGLSTATIGWVAAIAVGMYMSSQAWKDGVRANGSWATNDPKSWPMKVWDDNYYMTKAKFGKEFAGSELYAILSGNSLSKVVHEAIFGGAKRDTGEFGLRATLGSGGVDTDIGAYWKKKGGLFGGSKSGIRWSTASTEIDAALETVIDSVKSGIVKLGNTFGDTTLADKIAKFAGSFDTKITGTLEQAFTTIGGQVRDALVANLFPSIESMRKTTTDSSGKSTTEEWKATFERVVDQANFVVGMVEMMGNSVASAFGKDNAEKVLNLSDSFVSLFGSLDTLKQQWDAYYQAYYSETERVANTKSSVAKVFADLDIAMPSTRDGFRALVESLDLASSAGQTTYATLLGVASAFGTVADAPAKLSSSIDGMFLSSSEQLEKAFSKLGKPIPATVDAYYELVKAQDLNTVSGQDMAKALLDIQPVWQQVQDSVAAVAQERSQLESQLWELQGNTVALRNKERDALNESNRALYDQIKAISDYSDSLNKQLQDITDTYGDLKSAMDKISPPAKTLVELWADNTQKLSTMSEGLARALGTAADQTDLDKLTAAMGIISGIASTLSDLDSQIFDLKAGRGDQAAIDFLKAEEAKLTSQLASAADPAAVASKLAQVTIQRINAQAQLNAKAMDAVYKEQYDSQTKAISLESDNRKKQVEALNSQLELVKSIGQAAKELSQYVDNLKFGDLSALNPLAQLNAAESQFNTLLAGARNNDVEALSNLSSAASAYLSEAQGYFGGATSPYAGIFSDVLSSLDSLGIGLTSTASGEDSLQQQLDALQAIEDSTVELQTSVVDTAYEQITALNAIRDKLLERELAIKDQAAEYQKAVQTQIDLVKVTIANQEAQIKQMAAVYDGIASKLENISNSVSTIESNSNLQAANA